MGGVESGYSGICGLSMSLVRWTSGEPSFFSDRICGSSPAEDPITFRIARLVHQYPQLKVNEFDLTDGNDVR